MKIQFVISIVTAFLEILFFSGVLFGWPSLEYVLKKEGYFSSLCDNETLFNSTLNRTNLGIEIGCKEQHSSFNLIFTLAIASVYTTAFPCGWLLDRYGTWIFRSIFTTAYTLGFILLTISSPNLSFLLYPAIILIAVSGANLLVSDFQLSCLVMPYKGSIMTLMTGLFSSSALLFFIIKQGYENGTDLSAMFFIMTCLTVFLWIRTFVLMPRKLLRFPFQDACIHIGYKEWKCFQKPKVFQHVMPIHAVAIAGNKDVVKTVVEACKNQPKQQKSFKSCIKSSIFWTSTYHLSVIGFNINFVFGTFQQWLKSFADPKNISKLTNDFGIVIMFSAFSALLNGVIMDFIRKKTKWIDKNPKVISLQASLVSMVITSTFGIMLSLMMIIFNPYGMFVFLLFTLGFVYGGTYTFMSAYFPPEHFGKIFGLANFLRGCVGLLQYSLFQLSLSVDPTFRYINIGILIAVMLTLLHPLLMYFEIRKLKKENVQVTNIDQGVRQTIQFANIFSSKIDYLMSYADTSNKSITT